MKCVKKCVSLPQETITQIEALRKMWVHSEHVSFSAMIAECVNDAYWTACRINNNAEKELLLGTTSHGGTHDPVYDDNGFLISNAGE